MEEDNYGDRCDKRNGCLAFPDEIDEDETDIDGNYWPDYIDYICSYKMVDIEEEEPDKLTCDLCGKEETPPYDEGDSCYCGGKFAFKD